MEVRLTPGGMTVPEAPPGEGQSARRAVASESGEVLPRRDSGADAQDRPAGFGLDKEDSGGCYRIFRICEGILQ